MKRIKIIFGAVLMTALLVGCGDATMNSERERMLIEMHETYRIYIDRDTGVQYLSRGDSLCVMVDRDGNPLIANGWRDYGE